MFKAVPNLPRQLAIPSLILSLSACLSACGGGQTDPAAPTGAALASDTSTTPNETAAQAVAVSASTPATDASVALVSGDEAILRAQRDKTAPTLLVSTPSLATLETGSATLKFAGTSKDDVQVKAVTWVNDKGGTGSATLTGKQPAMLWTIDSIPLQEGLNAITLVAADTSGNTSRQVLSITRKTTTTTPTGTLITDQRIMALPSPGVYPAKGVKMANPSTGFPVMRLSDAQEMAQSWNGGSSKMSSIVYSRYTPSNVLGDMVVVHGMGPSSAVYRADGTLATVLRFKPSMGAASRSLGDINEVRWDYTGKYPYRLYFVGRSLPTSQGVRGENVGMSFYYLDINPTTGVQSDPVVIRDFSSDFPTFTNGEIINDVEGDSSVDSRYWAWQVMNTTLGSGYRPYAVITYDKQLNKVTGTIQRSCAGSRVSPCVAINTPAQALPYLTRPNMVEMSPLGTRVIVHWDRAYTGHNDADIGGVSDGPRAFKPDFTDPIRVATDATHSGWAWGAGGEELFVSQNNRNDYWEAVDVTSATSAHCVAIPNNLNSWSCGTKIAHATDIDPTWSMGMHIGKIYDRSKRGWVALVTSGADYSQWGFNQSLMVEVNDVTKRKSRVVRLGPTNNVYYDYFSEGHGGLDFKAENLYITANWGFKDGRSDAFKVSLPKDWWAMLPK